MGLALAKALILVVCFGGAAFFIRDARRNLREHRTLFASTFLADGKIQSFSQSSDPNNFRFVVGLKFFAATIFSVFGLVYLWFALAG